MADRDCRYACAAFPHCGCTVEALRPPCGVPFMACTAPSETVYQGVRCGACGQVMSAQEWDAIETAHEIPPA